MQTRLKVPHLATIIASTALAIVVTTAVTLAPPQVSGNSPPDAPTNVTAIRSGDGIKIDWDDVHGAASYNVNHTHNNGRSWHRTKSDVSGNSHTASNTLSRADYTFAVQACSSSGCSQWANSNQVQATAKPQAPSYVGIKHRGHLVNFWWPMPPGGASTYDLVGSSNHKSSWSRLFTGYRQNKAHIKNAKAHKTYYTAVRACNSQGCSAWTDSPAAHYVNPPGPVSGITTTYTGTQIKGVWNAAARASKYHATYSCKVNQSFALGGDNANIPGNVTQRTVAMPQSLADASKCWVSVRAGNHNGWGPWRNSSPSTVTAPDKVTAPNVVKDQGVLTVTYSAAARATKYETQYYCGTSASWKQVGDTQYVGRDVLSVSHTLTSEEQGQTCYGKTRGRNGAGAGEFSDTVSVGPTPAAVTPTVRNIPGKWILEYTASAAATRYEIQSKKGSADWEPLDANFTGTKKTIGHNEVSVFTKTNFRVAACNAVGCSAAAETGLSPKAAPTTTQDDALWFYTSTYSTNCDSTKTPTKIFFRTNGDSTNNEDREQHIENAAWYHVDFLHGSQAHHHGDPSKYTSGASKQIPEWGNYPEPWINTFKYGILTPRGDGSKQMTANKQYYFRVTPANAHGKTTLAASERSDLTGGPICIP